LVNELSCLAKEIDPSELVMKFLSFELGSGIERGLRLKRKKRTNDDTKDVRFHAGSLLQQYVYISHRRFQSLSKGGLSSISHGGVRLKLRDSKLWDRKEVIRKQSFPSELDNALPLDDP